MSLTDSYVPKTAAAIGKIELVLNDEDGTPAGMSSRGQADVKAADGTVIETRRGDPQQFIPQAWKLKLKQVLDELRAEVAQRLLLILLAVLLSPVTVRAQAIPELDAEVVSVSPALSELEAARVDISLLNEMIVRLKIEKAALERELDILRLAADRQARTPAPKDGHVWDWTIDAQTGRPKGFVKAPAPDTKK